VSKDYILAYDVGTMGTKACLFRKDGFLEGSVYKTYPTYYPAPGFAEQEPEAWLNAVKESAREIMLRTAIDGNRIAAISFSGQALGVVPVSQEGRLLTERVMVWLDTRSTKEAQRIIEIVGDREHFDITGNSYEISQCPCSKIMWIIRNQPALYRKTFKFLAVKDYIISRLTGTLGITDHTEAACTGLYALKQRAFCDKLIQAVGMDSDKLCQIAESTTIVGALLREPAQEMNLREGTPVALGAMDGSCCVLGAGGLNPEICITYIGTAGWIGVTTDEPIISPDFKSHVRPTIDGKYFTSIHSHSAGAAYQWVIDLLGGELNSAQDPYEKFNKLAETVGPGSDGLYFMPSMYTGNTMYSSPTLRGAYIGLTIAHHKAHLIRAAMEGIGLDLMMGAEFFKSKRVVPKQVRMIGGGAKSLLWHRILASMYGVDIWTIRNMQNIGSLGAAIIGGVASGILKGLDSVDGMIELDTLAQPIPSWSAVYVKSLPIYRQLYEALMPVYDLAVSIHEDTSRIGGQ
jgi:xylulokinase